MKEFTLNDFTNGLIDTIIFLVALKIFQIVVNNRPEWTNVTVGEGLILVVLTGLALIWTARYFVKNFPKSVAYIVQEYLKTDHAKKSVAALNKQINGGP